MDEAPKIKKMCHMT